MTMRHYIAWTVLSGTIVLGIFFAAFLTLQHSEMAQAEDASSASFRTKDGTIDDFGGNATSSGFQLLNAGGQNIIGDSTSTNFIMRSGPLNFDEFSPASRRWRWYADATSETPVVPLDSENSSPINIQNNTPIKLRITLAEQNNIGLGGAKFRLQFSKQSDFSSDVFYVEESQNCISNSAWCYTDGAGNDNALISTKLLSDADACSSSVGQGCGTHNESGISTSTQAHGKGAAAEYEFTIKNFGAQTNAVYYFRPYDTVSQMPVTLIGTSTYPSVLTESGALEFSIQGLASGTSTEGIITDVSTTPTSVPFGGVSFSSQIEAGQRIKISSNAPNGYTILMYDRQGLLGPAGAEVDPIISANSSPASWASACASSAPSCYGYHSGDDVLSGGSARFAANDTYAKFETSTREVAFNSGTVSNETIDMIYKLEVRSTQLAGDYQDGIVYIVVPIF